MTTFAPNTFVKLYVTHKQTEDDQTFIYLSDGQRDTYRVKAYDYQAEWEDSLLPQTMSCYVRKVDYRGLPFLEQSIKDVLQELYSEKDFYPFKLLAKKTDSNTNANFYELNDTFGLYHRFYLQDGMPDHDIGDIFSLWVDGIDDKGQNKAYLKLSYREQKSEVEVQHSEETNEDPRAKSKFGFEDNQTEFKSSIVFPAGQVEADVDKQIQIIVKTIAGFQNADGGQLLIGVNDSGEVSGIAYDYPYLNTSNIDNYTYHENRDGYENKIRVAVKTLLGSTANKQIKISFDNEGGDLYCFIDIEKSNIPIFMQGVKLFQRAGNMTQLIKGDEITHFIESKLIQRFNLSASYSHDIEVEHEDSQMAVSPKPEAKKQMVAPEIQPKHDENINHKDIWKYLYLYKNGNWSFSNQKENIVGIEKLIEISKDLKKGYLVLAYDNGRVNVVSIMDLIRPRRKSGRRKMRPPGKIYTTGWNTDASFINVFVTDENDLLSFESTTKDGKEWGKLHRVSDISVHDINAQGNVLINERFDDAEINSCLRIPSHFYPNLTGLVLKPHQTSSSLGYRKNNPAFKKLFVAFEKIKNIMAFE